MRLIEDTILEVLKLYFLTTRLEVGKMRAVFNIVNLI